MTRWGPWSLASSVLTSSYSPVANQHTPQNPADTDSDEDYYDTPEAKPSPPTPPVKYPAPIDTPILLKQHSSHQTLKMASRPRHTPSLSRSSAESIDTHSMSAETFLANSKYADRARKLQKMVNNMRDAGAHMDLDLPTVVVCGNQSVGKSSVLEAICGVELPRAEGTCTRSVTEVRLSTAGEGDQQPWSCTLKLRYEYDSHSRPLKSMKEVPFGPPITSKSDVEISVRRAQKALLNPSVDPDRYLSYRFDDSSAATRDKEAHSNELKFTRNIVCVEIKGAATNLTLIDLPGIIRSVDRKEDSGYIDVVQELVRHYIEKERAIIVATITCKDEMDNQAIVHMAKEVDPYGLRTLGVLTKPDTIEPGTHDRWLQVLLGQNWSLQLGYWVVKNPSKSELDKHITFEDARKREEYFFSSQQPWAGLRPQLDRFGVDSLRRELSRQLTILTDASLPDMKARTEEAMRTVQTELDKLPPALGDNARIELLGLVRHFCTLVNYSIQAQQDFRGFYQRVHRLFEEFRNNLAGSRPVFAIDKKPIPPSAPPTPSGLISSSISSISSVLPSPFFSSSPATPTKPTASSDSDPPTINLKKPLTTNDVKKIIETQKGRELQGYSPYGAFTYVISQFQEEWEGHAVGLLQKVAEELGGLVGKLVEEVFGRFPNLSGQVR
ncbi:hypothetical protein HK097_004558 [Rhizophlyctis rosea]|uniref:Dynamin-type G domain-containing protein n=1 Tax=Rhizophlyctis rosea TaxID=64517 RepID=A0AAD5S8Q3_9FUNG|nr:hypothetical protein HK097_004558 [Rhizophlyctis rosea]